MTPLNTHSSNVEVIIGRIPISRQLVEDIEPGVWSALRLARRHPDDHRPDRRDYWEVVACERRNSRARRCLEEMNGRPAGPVHRAAKKPR